MATPFKMKGMSFGEGTDRPNKNGAMYKSMHKEGAPDMKTGKYAHSFEKGGAPDMKTGKYSHSFEKGAPMYKEEGAPMYEKEGAPKYKNDQQRMAVHASKADGGKGAPKLVGGQHKLDKNKDGELSKVDFDMMNE